MYVRFPKKYMGTCPTGCGDIQAKCDNTEMTGLFCKLQEWRLHYKLCTYQNYVHKRISHWTLFDPRSQTHGKIIMCKEHSQTKSISDERPLELSIKIAGFIFLEFFLKSKIVLKENILWSSVLTQNASPTSHSYVMPKIIHTLERHVFVFLNDEMCHCNVSSVEISLCDITVPFVVRKGHLRIKEPNAFHNVKQECEENKADELL